MKTNKILKVMCIILLIVILVMVSFVGIFVKDNGRLINIVKDYTLGSEFGMEKEFVFSVSDEKKTEYYDKDGNLVLDEDVDTEAEEGTYTTKEVDVNLEENKNVDNYKIVKEIMEKRIRDLGLEEAIITLDEETGDIVLKTINSNQIDSMSYAISGQGEFLLKDAETNEVLLDNNDIKDATVGYYNDTAGTSVYLTINLDKEGKKKLEDISSKYIKTTEKEEVTAEDGTVSEEEKEVTKNVKLYIDGYLVVNTYFGEPIKTGQLQLTMGSSITDTENLQQTLLSASIEATKLSYGNLPLIYEISESTNILNTISKEKITFILVISIIIFTFILIYFVIRYKERGIISSVLFVGFTALYLLVIRYANVSITYSSIAGLIFIELFNIIFVNKVLFKLKHLNINNETPKRLINNSIIKSIFVLIPVLIFAIVCALFTFIGVSSLGIMLFWGIILFIIYSYVFIKTLLLNYEYLFEQ